MPEFIPPDNLNAYICEFLLWASKPDGKEYEPTTLKGFVSSIDRYLKSKNSKLSILNDAEFYKARMVLKGKQKQLKSMGYGNKPKTAEPLQEEHINKMYECKTLGDENPRSLIHSLWLICTTYFGMRTGQEVHNLRWGDVKLEMDDQTGEEYLVLNTERQPKLGLWPTPKTHVSTLYAARNAVNARNVTKDPGDNFYAASSLLDKYTEALVIAGGLTALNLDTIDAELTEENSQFDDIKEKAKAFIQEFCIPKVPETNIETEQFDCHLCGRKYVRKGNLLRHLKSVHKQESVVDADSSSDDFKVNYTKCALPVLMLRWNHNDAISYCDGDRLELCHKFLIPYYKATGCVKYAFGTLEYLAQLKFLMSPRQAFRLKWNRTANGRGCIDSNFPLDLDVEHENKVFKEHITTYRGEVTESIIDTVSRSVDTSETVARNLDKISNVFQQSGKHSTKESHCDRDILVRQFIQADLFREQPGRCHAAFPNISANPFARINVEDFKTWIKQSVKKYHQKHFYN